ncbi:DUF3152 domain-containing protein [Streptomyces sp. NPDC002187]|uniref:DUF3152 domain-containing protein n=1 Tax=Streptomyces sp. NPDC002187 TaxID=3364637 RepID=UPI0036B0420F
MGRHSRKGPVPRGAGPADTPGAAAAAPGGGQRRRGAAPGPEQHTSGGYGAAQTRGGHPEQHEPGGGWGDLRTAPGTSGAQRTQTQTYPPQRAMVGGPRIPGPRREFVEAFDTFGEFPRQAPHPDPYASVTEWDTMHGRPAETAAADDVDAAAGLGVSETGDERPAKGGKGRAFTGIAAAAVTTVLAVVVAGQVVTDPPDTSASRSSSQEREAQERPDRSDGRGVPPKVPPPAAAPQAPTYSQLMAKRFPIDPGLEASGDFEAVAGFDEAPGEGRKIRYRVDVEKGLGLDGALFAKAVQETLNDDRSWAHKGEMTFERVSSGDAEFVITLASPGTTAEWCAKSDLDTSVDNVSCDSALTERVMINAFRWAQGAETYGPDAMFAYRQMLINHEVGHRLGYDHVNCETPGAPAPVMQQQTKSLDIDGVKCRPNPWVYPGK